MIMDGNVGRKDRTIGQRINVLLVSAIVLATSLLAISLVTFQVHDVIKDRKAALEGIGYVYASAIAESLAAADSDSASRTLKSVQHLKDLVGIYAITPDEHVLANAGAQVFLSTDLIKGDATLFRMLTQGLIPVSVQVIKGGQAAGRLVVIGDVSGIRKQLLDIFLATVLALAGALSVTLYVASRVRQGITKPIYQLTQSITNLRLAKRFEKTSIPHAEGETRELVENFNGMVVEIKERDSALLKLAFHDDLTGLPNAAFMQRQFHDLEAIAGGLNGHCVAVIEIENFKTIAATLGQTIADQLILEVAKRFAACKAGDATISRFGTEAFSLLHPHVHSQAEAQALLAPFVASLYQAIALAGHQIHIAAAFGYSLGSAYNQSGSELLRQAQLALAEAKSNGVARVCCYEPALGARADEEAAIESGLRNAIANQEVEVHYQPIVDLQNMRVEGFEALLRWRRADGIYIPPGKFVPIAERAGLITELGEWILRQACKDAMSWIDHGFTPRYVSVNVSASQIMLSGFQDTVQRALQETCLPAHLLCLELTESLFVGGSMKQVAGLLGEIRALGVTLALDDFGTGYSSLSYLEHLPFDKLKIDRSFVHVPDASSSAAPLLAGIVNLAHALGIAVVAEGAELAGEVAMLRKLECESVQGYYFAKPMPNAQALAKAEEIEKASVALVGPPGLEPGTRRL